MKGKITNDWNIRTCNTFLRSMWNRKGLGRMYAVLPSWRNILFPGRGNGWNRHIGKLHLMDEEFTDSNTRLPLWIILLCSRWRKKKSYSMYCFPWNTGLSRWSGAANRKNCLSRLCLSDGVWKWSDSAHDQYLERHDYPSANWVGLNFFLCIFTMQSLERDFTLSYISF